MTDYRVGNIYYYGLSTSNDYYFISKITINGIVNVKTINDDSDRWIMQNYPDDILMTDIFNVD